MLLKKPGRPLVLPSKMKASHAAPAAIEGLYRERFSALLLSVTALFRDGEAALDVVQDGFALALARRETFRNEGSLEAWLWRIVLNVARDELRSQKRPGSRPVQLYARDAHDDDLRVKAACAARTAAAGDLPPLLRGYVIRPDRGRTGHLGRNGGGIAERRPPAP
jgi:DNA-directed RNA polymerase specialized sigma24 family protein